MPGTARRRLYKPERRPARKKGVLALEKQAPVACPDASHSEIAMALAACCIQGNMKVGRGGEYDALKDEYTVIGKVNGKAQDIKIPGWQIAWMVDFLRQLNGGRFDKQGLTRQVGGLREVSGR